MTYQSLTHSMSQSTLKQNILPTRQGQLYRVNLLSSQSDGPYLKKDIMPNNKKSMALLTGSRQVLQSITHFNNSMVMLQTKTKQASMLFPQNVDNLTHTYHYCEAQLQIAFTESSKLAKQEQRLKSQLQRIYQQQKSQQNQLYGECMPLLKNLFKTVKQARNKQKEEYHLMERQLEEIAAAKKVLVEGMIECERRIKNLEKVIGCRTGQCQADQHEE